MQRAGAHPIARDTANFAKFRMRSAAGGRAAVSAWQARNEWKVAGEARLSDVSVGEAHRTPARPSASRRLALRANGRRPSAYHRTPFCFFCGFGGGIGACFGFSAPFGFRPRMKSV